MIERSQYVEGTEGRQTGPSFWINMQDSLITLDVTNAELNRTVRETANQAGVDIFLLGDLKGNVNAQCKNVSFDNVLNYLFKGTNYTFRQEDDIYFIGDKSMSGMGTIHLIRLNHIKAEGITDILPPSIKQNATIQIIKEHNALMVVGSQDVIREAEAYIQEIDYPIPQILIEAIVVDYNTSDIGAFGITAGMRDPNDSTSILDTGLLFPSLDILVSSDRLNQRIDYNAPKLGITNLGYLPENFYLGLKALETEGKANILSRPQIATLNGHPASIKIGTTQYYQLETYQPIVGGNTAFQQTSQRFEKITAEISLTITPWVSASGEITTEIKPEFSTPHQQFDPKVPPAIDHRILDSTVRLRDGETIVLGGLTLDSNEETIQKLPILGDVPIIGRLFQNRSHNNTKSELMIYITPHLNYTDDYIQQDGGIIR